MTTNIRMRQAALAVAIEAAGGTDAIDGTPAAGDWIAGRVTYTMNPMVIQDPTDTGALDMAPDSVGGFKPTLQIVVPLRGSGTAGTPPALARLFQICTMVPTATDAAIGTPTAAAAGTETTATGDTPFAATADLYNGMPLLVSGDQVFTTGIIDYTAAKVISIGETRDDALTTSSLLQIPINDRYDFSSDESAFDTGTVYCFHDGVRARFVGNQGTWSLDLTAGQGGTLTFNLIGQLLEDPTTTALPAGAATALVGLPPIPIWINGRSQLNLGTARIRSFRLDAGVQLITPDNPEATYGFDPAVPIGRKIVGTMDPLADTATHTTFFSAMKAGTALPFIAIIGSTAGNRILITIPALRLMDMPLQDREGLGAHAMAYQAVGNNTGASICFF